MKNFVKLEQVQAEELEHVQGGVMLLYGILPIVLYGIWPIFKEVLE